MISRVQKKEALHNLLFKLITPYSKTIAMIIDEFKKEYKIKISESTIRRALNNLYRNKSIDVVHIDEIREDNGKKDGRKTIAYYKK